MTEAVTVSNLIAIASPVSEIRLAKERQTDRQTDNTAFSILTFSKSKTTKKPKQTKK